MIHHSQADLTVKNDPQMLHDLIHFILEDGKVLLNKNIRKVRMELLKVQFFLGGGGLTEGANEQI